MKTSPAITKEARSFEARNIKDFRIALWSVRVSCEFTESHVINSVNIHANKLSERWLYLSSPYWNWDNSITRESE